MKALIRKLITFVMRVFREKCSGGPLDMIEAKKKKTKEKKRKRSFFNPNSYFWILLMGAFYNMIFS